MFSSPLYKLLLFSVICITLCQDNLTRMSFDSKTQGDKDHGTPKKHQSEYFTFDDGYCSRVAGKYVQSEYRHLDLLLLGFKKIVESPEYKALISHADFLTHNDTEIIFSAYFDGWMLDIFNQFNEINDVVFALLESKLLTANGNVSRTTVKTKHISRSRDSVIKDLNDTDVYECSINGKVRNWDNPFHDKNVQCLPKSRSGNVTRTRTETPDIHMLDVLFMNNSEPTKWKTTCNSDTAVMARVSVPFSLHSLMTEAPFASGKYASR